MRKQVKYGMNEEETRRALNRLRRQGYSIEEDGIYKGSIRVANLSRDTEVVEEGSEMFPVFVRKSLTTIRTTSGRVENLLE